MLELYLLQQQQGVKNLCLMTVNQINKQQSSAGARSPTSSLLYLAGTPHRCFVMKFEIKTKLGQINGYLKMELVIFPIT